MILDKFFNQHSFIGFCRWTYRCARKLDWGDRYPVEFADDDGGDIESFDESDESDDENE